VFSTEDLVLVKVLRQEKGYDNLTIDEWSHCFNWDNCERTWVLVVTETCVLDE